jgi:YVTN family beta-propeller protein
MLNRFKILAGVALVAAGVLSAPLPAGAAVAPKAYIGLFKDNAVAVFDTGSNTVSKTIPIPTGPHGLVVTPDGRWVYASSDGDSVVSVIDTNTDTVSATIDVGQTPHGLAIAPDGSLVLVSGFGTDSVEAIDTSTNTVVWQVPVPQPHNIAITPDGQTAYVGGQKSGEEQIAIIDIPSATQTGTLPLDHTPRALTVSPDGADLTYTLAGVDALQVLDLSSLQLATQIPTGASPHHPQFTPDGMLGMVVSQGPGTLDLFNPATFTAIGKIKVGTMPHWIGVSSDSRWAYVTNENSNDISVVDLSDRSVKATVPVGNAPRKIAVQPGDVPVAAGGAPAAAPKPTPTTAPAAQPAPPAATGGISIASFAFAPNSLTVKAGQTVAFTNNDPIAHTTTSSAWDSGNIQPGGTFMLTAPSTAGSYAFHCSIHPFMMGTLVVQ